MEKILFKNGNRATPIALYVLEKTKIGGFDYIMVTDAEEGEDGDALILREMASADSTDSVYEIVTDDRELGAVGAVFESLLEDTAIEE
jgi:hypothetical protein